MTGRASAHGSADRLDTAAAASPTGIVAWYAQGFADRLGDRLLLFDNTGAPPLELLRIAQRLTGDPGFEPALRERVEELKPFRHPAFARVRGVSVLAEPTPQLALVSEHIPGERLSHILREARAAGFRPDPGTALWLVRQLMPAISALHEMGAEIAHGTLSPDRIIVTPTGDLVVTEYVLAHALESLGAEPSHLWKELGVAVRPGARPRRIDQRGDIEQVALLALAVLLGRPLAPDEYPRRVRELLDEACDPLRWSLVPPLRLWLNRALRIDAKAFATARAALESLDELLPRVSGMWAPRLLPQNLAARTGGPLDVPPAGDLDAAAGAPLPTTHAATALPYTPEPSAWDMAAPADVAPIDTDPLPPLDPAITERARDFGAPAMAVPDAGSAVAGWAPRGLFADIATAAPDDAPPAPSPAAAALEHQTIQRLWLLCAALAVIAVLEALCLLVLLGFTN